MFIVGLTGGIATGKSTVLSIFRENGIAVIDADEVAHEVMQKGTYIWRQIGKKFGDTIYCEDGTINRILLAEIVFNDTDKRKALNAITHPKIQQSIIKKAIVYFIKGHSYVVLELPLLFETGRMYSFMHKIITVTCEDYQQLERLCNRSSMSEEHARLRINSQMPLSEKVAKSDFVVNNSYDLNHTREQTESIIAKLHNWKITWYFKNTVKVIILTLASVYLFKLFKLYS